MPLSQDALLPGGGPTSCLLDSRGPTSRREGPVPHITPVQYLSPPAQGCIG